MFEDFKKGTKRMIQENEKTKDIKEYVYANETGDAQLTVYHIFPGVEVAYVSVHMVEFDFGLIEQELCENYIGIHYCREGRIEQEIGKEFFYLMPGDCSIIVRNKTKRTFQLPLKHYHGICIGIDLEVFPNPFVEFLEKCGFTLFDIVKHSCKENSYAIFRSVVSVKNFFEELYKVDGLQGLDYLRIKLPELFYQMKYTKLDDDDKSLVPRTQVELVKRAADYISQNINEKITVKKLTMEFGISDTYLQNSFRSVYGMPVISFIRVQKMQSAAQVLIHTTRTIDEIAEEFGYENESKFSAAFKKIMGDSPGVYRREHSKVKIL